MNRTDSSSLDSARLYSSRLASLEDRRQVTGLERVVCLLLEAISSGEGGCRVTRDHFHNSAVRILSNRAARIEQQQRAAKATRERASELTTFSLQPFSLAPDLSFSPNALPLFTPLFLFSSIFLFLYTIFMFYALRFSFLRTLLDTFLRLSKTAFSKPVVRSFLDIHRFIDPFCSVYTSPCFVSLSSSFCSLVSSSS